MEKYKNSGGNSGVYAFEIGENDIKVQFSDGSVYLYNQMRPGRDAVEHMKGLARNGRGLNSYISSYIRKNFASKLR